MSGKRRSLALLFAVVAAIQAGSRRGEANPNFLTAAHNKKPTVPPTAGHQTHIFHCSTLFHSDLIRCCCGARVIHRRECVL